MQYRRNQNRRDNSRSNQNKRRMIPQVGNLRKISRVLSPDLLAAALGTTEEILSKIMEGRDPNLSDSYEVYFSSRLEEAGLPSTLLRTPDASITPAHIKALRDIATTSENKAPLRRVNFRKLVAAFQNDLGILEDALEMTSNSILGIASGELEVNEQRDSHISPRLLQAGFIPNWLEDGKEESLTPEQIEGIKKLAKEVHDEEEEAFFISQSAALEHYNTIDSPAKHEVNEAESEEVAEIEIEPKLEEATKESSGPTTFAPKGYVSNPKALPLREVFTKMDSPNDNKEKEMVKTVQKPSIDPSLRRAAAQVGRPMTRPVRPAKATPQESASAPAVSHKIDTPAPETKKVAAPSPSTPVEAKEKPSNVKRSGLSAEQEATASRVLGLEKVFEVARRGVKASLWRDILQIPATIWGNMRRGTAIFHDEHARKAEQAFGLPEGWLDAPTEELPKLANWVTDVDAPRPMSFEEAIASQTNSSVKKSTSVKEASKPVSKETVASAPSVKKERQPEAVQEEIALEEAAPQEEIIPSAPTPSPEQVKKTQQPAAKEAQQPEVKEAIQEPSPAFSSPTEGFAWTPSPKDPQEAVGPITGALLSVITELSKEGSFTDIDALTLLNHLAKNKQ